jgi:hypothetical protein
MGYAEAFDAGSWDRCDNCQNPKPKGELKAAMSLGLMLIWLCDRCFRG